MITRRNKLGPVLFALLVIAAGALLLSYHTGLISSSIKSIVFSWQMLLIAIGVLLLAQSHKRKTGFILIIIGSAFLLPHIFRSFYLFYGKGDALSWSIILILVGILLLGQALFGKSYCCSGRRRKGKEHHDSPNVHSSCGAAHRAPRNEAGYIDRDYVFGGGREVVDLPNFKGGEINCVFGGLEVDFTNAQLAEGTHTLEINTVFGGVTLYIPSHWRIDLRQTRVFGSFEDRRTRPYFEVEEGKTLIIVVSSVFGGGEIRSGE